MRRRFSGTLLCALIGLRGDFGAAKNAWKTYTAAILTVGLCNSVNAFVGNAVYETSLSFAFIQVVKCFTPVIVLLVGLAAGVEVLNPRVAGSVFIISVGMVMCVNGELNAEMFGIFLVLLGGFAEAIRLVGRVLKRVPPGGEDACSLFSFFRLHRFFLFLFTAAC